MGEELRDKVKERYAGAALTVLESAGSASCCGSAGERGLDSEAPLEKGEYERLLGEAGFEDVSVEVTHTYEEEFVEASGCCGGSGCCGDTAATEVPLASAFIRGRKPVGGVS